MGRKKGKKPTKTLWIFCEGKTEKSYFEKYKYVNRIGRLKIKVLDSPYKNADGMVRRAAGFKDKDINFQKGGLVACVFDRDRNRNDQLQKAKSLADSKEIILSFSNPCFEYWILCHYGYFPSQYEKRGLLSKLREHLPQYKKGWSELYQETCDHIETAKDNAERIRQLHIGTGKNLITRQANPLSLIFELVNKIEEFRD